MYKNLSGLCALRDVYPRFSPRCFLYTRFLLQAAVDAVGEVASAATVEVGSAETLEALVTEEADDVAAPLEAAAELVAALVPLDPAELSTSAMAAQAGLTVKSEETRSASPYPENVFGTQLNGS